MSENEYRAVYYEKLLSAWIDTKMTRDRTLVQLSVAGIGLLVTLLTTAGPHGLLGVTLCAVACLGFVGALLVALLVFEANAEYLEREFADSMNSGNPTLGSPQSEVTRRRHLRRLDKCLFGLFVFAVMVSVMFGVVSQLDSINKGRESTMTQEENAGGEARRMRTYGNNKDRSLMGIEAFRPRPPETPGSTGAGVPSVSPPGTGGQPSSQVPDAQSK